ncbi:OsmC family protein [Thermonema rossianum]|uniref:OsmC family protein n=1 Tax=Thermonema rossianum TaxID=55505 RepID=UPI000571C630|nr:OsmC family protein [Thermonema rossianum]
MIRRKATAQWQGSGKAGKGTLTTQSHVLQETPYSFHSRFEEGEGTNPEELIAAAHAGCFAMKLAFNLQEAGFEAEQLEVSCTIEMKDGTIEASHLKMQAKVPGIDAGRFEALANDAKENCPISRLLNATVSLEYSLQQA